MPCLAEVVNRSLKADCTNYTEKSFADKECKGRLVNLDFFKVQDG